jgi:hypothetical protein
MAKYHLNLLLDEETVKKIKMRAIEENQTVGEITEQLYRQYLGLDSGYQAPTRTSLEHPKKVKVKSKQ